MFHVKHPLQPICFETGGITGTNGNATHAIAVMAAKLKDFALDREA
jgi:hypothetical protein